MPRRDAEKDIEVLAIWLHGASHALGIYSQVRKLVREAADEAIWMYGVPFSTRFEDSYGVRELIARFACKLDELERQRKQDYPELYL